MFVDNLEKVLHNMFINALREFIRDNKSKHKQGSTEREKIMNRHIFQKINEVTTVATPLIECPIQPSKNDESQLPREEKKPDITLRLVDYETRQHLDYHIECKRLNKPPSHYCKYYITKGVTRFIDSQYGYGCFCDLGFMIGYIQDLTFDKAFEAVNLYAVGNNIPPLKLINEDNEVSLSTLEHILNRRQEFSKFRLRHYWAEV
jgi:hypothetical protein